MSAPLRMGWIDPSSELAITRQCELAQVARASFYGRHTPCEPPEENLLLMRLIDEEYTRRPFYGSRRMVVFLGRQGHIVNRKRVQRLMRVMALAGMAPGPATSLPQQASIEADGPNADALRNCLRSAITFSRSRKRKPRTGCGVSFLLCNVCLANQAATSTADAWAPFGPWVTSNCTR